VHPTTSRRGFALITAILLLVVILALGYGSLYLSETSLHVNENTRSKAIARANADAGLDATILVVASAAAAGALPTRDFLATDPVTVVAPSGTTIVTVDVYDIDSDTNSVRIVVSGTGPRNARHTSEALIGAVAGALPGDPPGDPPRVDRLFSRGLIAKGIVQNSGGIAPIIDAEIHGDGGYKLEVDFRTCLSRSSTTGLCETWSPITEHFPLTAATQPAGFAYWCTVKPSTVDPCVGKLPMNRVEPVAVPVPDYTAIRNAVPFGAHTVGYYLDPAHYPTRCTHWTLPAVMPPKDSVICVTGNVDLTGRTMDASVLIIASGEIKSGGGSNLSNLTLVSTGNRIEMSGGNNFSNLRFFAQTNLRLSGGNTGGSSTIAAGYNVEMSGGSEAIAPSVDGGATTIGLAVIAGCNVKLSGGSVFYGIIWSGGCTEPGFKHPAEVELSGGSRVFGSITTTGDIKLSGGTFVDSNVNVVNPDLPTESGDGSGGGSETGLRLLSQR
jgi:hypothetical protein